MCKYYEKHFLTCELIISIVLIIGAYYCVIHFKLDYMVLKLLDQNRSALYGTISSISGALLGFIITGVSILLAMKESPALIIIKASKYYQTVFVVFTSACRYLGLNTTMALLGLLIDKDSSPHLWFFFIVLWASLISVFRLMRCLWVLEKMIKLSIKE